MPDAPERIWATINGASTRLPDGGRQLLGGWSQDRARPRAVEYVRADIAERQLAETRTELARARKLLERSLCEFAPISAENHKRDVRDFLDCAAIGAGGMAVKPLEWTDHPAGGEQAVAAGLALYRVHANGDDWYLVPEHMGKGGKSAAQADYERRIRSAIIQPAGERDDA